MGVPLIQHSWKAVFSSLKSLDEARFSSARAATSSQMVAVMLSIIGTVIASEDPHSYVNYYWHGFCKLVLL